MLDDAVEEFIASLSCEAERSNQNTIAAYRNDLNQFCAFLRRRNIENWPLVTRELIAAYILAMREEQSYRTATIARKLAALKSFFRYLCRSSFITIDPVQDMEAPHVQKELPNVLSAEEVTRLFRQVDVHMLTGQRDLAMLHMLYATGMRVSELVSLDVFDVDSIHATVTCPGNRGRAKRQRVLPLPSAALDVIRRYMQDARPRLLSRHPENEALFLNHHGERLTRQGFWLIIKGYARQANIHTITPHMLRHSFAMLMLNDGMELRSVQELLGHAHISTTQIYSQLVRAHTKTLLY